VVLVGGVPLVAQALTEESASEPARAAGESRAGTGPVFGARAPRLASAIPDLGADLAAPTAPVVEIAPVVAPIPDLAPSGPSVGQWAALRQCESGGDYSITSRSGKYRGAYQFDRSTWNSVAERHAPALVGVDPAHASSADQDALALALYSERGARPWPHCGRHLG
jgi:hypothetical protein